MVTLYAKQVSVLEKILRKIRHPINRNGKGIFLERLAPSTIFAVDVYTFN